MLLADFFQRYFEEGMPCSFHYDHQPAAAGFGPLTRDEASDGDGFLAYRRTFKEEAGNFAAVLKIRKFDVAVEWWLEMTGTGLYDSDLVDELRYADITLRCADAYHSSAWKFPRFHWAHGSLAQEDDFQPVCQNFCPESRHVLECGGGRSSSGCMPYFNLQMDEGKGCVFAIGWSGQWRATMDCQRIDNRPVRFTAEMDDACFRVQSGETLVLPKMMAMPWEGELVESFNAWRRLIKWNILPKYDGKPLEGYVLLRSWGGLTPEIHQAKFANVKKHQLNAELYQIDAGWHGDETTPQSKNYYFDLWGKTVGIWKPLPALYPDGFGSMNRACRDAGMGFCIWFEPERMPSWNKMVSQHREYFVGPKLPDRPNHGELWNASFNMMVNLGYEPAREWLLGELSKVIEDSHMEVFRIDFNYEPLEFWKYNDAMDRRGVSEIKYVNGCYAMLDALLQRHPGLKIDNCASGGRRLDYRMFRRSIPMICRSDYFCGQDNEPDPKQCHTYGLSMWTPCHADSLGSCIGHTPECMDTYRVRSSMCSGVGMTAPWWDMKEEEAAWYRKTLADAKRVREYISEDFYPLTGYSLSPLDWMAWQTNAPATGKGMIMAFRREKSGVRENAFALHGIDQSAEYRLEDMDSGDLGVVSGKELAEGYVVAIPEKRMCRILFYEKL